MVVSRPVAMGRGGACSRLIKDTTPFFRLFSNYLHTTQHLLKHCWRQRLPDTYALLPEERLSLYRITIVATEPLVVSGVDRSLFTQYFSELTSSLIVY